MSKRGKNVNNDFYIDQSYVQINFKKDFSIIDYKGELANLLEPLFKDSYLLEMSDAGLLYTCNGIEKLRQFKVTPTHLWFSFDKGTEIAELYEKTQDILKEVRKVKEDIQGDRIGWRNKFVCEFGKVTDPVLFQFKEINVEAFICSEQKKFGKHKIGLRYEVTTGKHKDDGKGAILLDIDAFLLKDKDITKGLRCLFDYYSSESAKDINAMIKIIKPSAHGQ